MKQVFALPESVELQLLKNLLEEANIRCELRNEQLAKALPGKPFNGELWVAENDDFPRAQQLCQAWLHPPRRATGTSACAQCGQRLRSQFDWCWKCGAKRETGTKNKQVEQDENISWFVD